jgi:predicted ABC-type ATPase
LSDAPFLLVVAGPNGSGKGTLTDHLIEAGLDFGEYINPDEIASTLDLPQPERSRQAQVIADFQRNRCLLSGLSFSFETVMSHPSKLDFMIRAHEAGDAVRTCNCRCLAQGITSAERCARTTVRI